MSLLRALVAEFDAIRANLHNVVNPEQALAAKTEKIWRELVEKMHELERRIEALVEPTKPADTAAATAQAQPAVAQNTGSGAAPEAPAATPASDGAAQPPAAAGTAPEQAQA